MLKDEYWQAVLKRDRSLDGIILYAVTSTKIYCFPSCPSRKPKRANVLFFYTYIEAEKAGFRPCKRCFPNQDLPKQANLQLIAQICREIDRRIEDCANLAELATCFNLSPSYLQRLFKKVVGISPRQYAEISRFERFKLTLQHSENITEAIYQAGYNSSSSLYQKISLKLGMTPKTYQQQGKEVQIIYTIVACNLGYLLIATTNKGICAIKLGDRPQALVTTLTEEFKQATIIHNDRHHQDWIEKILDFIAGKQADPNLPLDIRGTVFQQQVWQALQNIPYGETRTYQEIARDIGKPQATRAIGNACGANPIALMIPCHRVIRSDGSLGGYRWGIERKEKLIETETKNIDR